MSAPVQSQGDARFGSILLKNSPEALRVARNLGGVRTMMGSQGGSQEQLFYSFSLEDHVPKDHLIRGIR